MASGIDDNVLVGGESKEVTPMVIATLDAEGKAQIGAERTPAATVVIASGTVAAGKQAVMFVPSTDFEGTILGQEACLEMLKFEARSGEVLGPIAYTVTAGSLTIYTL